MKNFKFWLVLNLVFSLSPTLWSQIQNISISETITQDSVNYTLTNNDSTSAVLEWVVIQDHVLMLGQGTVTIPGNSSTTIQVGSSSSWQQIFSLELTASSGGGQKMQGSSVDYPKEVSPQTIERDFVGTFSVFPNPVNGTLHLTLPNESDEFSLDVLDLQGVPTLSNHPVSGNMVQLRTDQFAAGVYYLRLRRGQWHQIRKVVITN